QEEVDRLAHAPPPAAGAHEEPEHDVAELVLDLAVAAGLLAHLAPRRLGERLLARDVALGQLPARAAARGDEADLEARPGRSPQAPRGALLSVRALPDHAVRIPDVEKPSALANGDSSASVPWCYDAGPTIFPNSVADVDRSMATRTICPGANPARGTITALKP